MRLHEEIDRPNLFVKIPATEPGLGAIEESIAQGQVDQHHADLLARALQGRRRGVPPRARAARRGRRRSRARRVGRVVLRLAGRHRGRQAARGDRANAELAGQARDREREARLPALPRGVLRARAGRRSPRKGATPQRCLWASTSTKNPDYRDVLYVEELIGPDTVNTMPPRRSWPSRITATVARTRSTSGVDEAERLLDELREAGVDYDDVTDTLEREGVQKFADSFEELLDGIRAKRSRARDGVTHARRADLGLRRHRLDRRGRGSLARLARRRRPDPAARATS